MMAKAKAKVKAKAIPSSLTVDSGGGVVLHLDPMKDRDELKAKVASGWTLSDPDGLLDNDPNKDWFFRKVSKFWSDEAIEAGDHKPKRARNAKGHLMADDPSTPDVNEAFEE